MLVKKAIFDNIHGYIGLTRAEMRVLESPYYQRLRWVQQLGFSFYIYPGATHTRFAHALGVLHVIHQIIGGIGKAVSDERLFDPAVNDEPTRWHRTVRMAALLHDVGTFPLSHTIELAYINHWKQQRAHGHKAPMANHENLGRHIITQTNFAGGVTQILREEGLDPKAIADIISGTSEDFLANQLLHSDVDADRMDYLIRDAYYTGVKLGIFDRDLLIKNMAITEFGGQEVLCVREEAINVVENFLIARYSWYSQIINDGASYKFDLMAAKIYEYFLENGKAYSFDHLLKSVSQNPDEYFTFNDAYFMARLNEYLAGRITHPVIRELSEMVAYRVTPKQIKLGPVQPTLVESEEHRSQLIKQCTQLAGWLEDELKRLDPKAWMVFDIPNRDVAFTQNHESLKKHGGKISPLLTRDPVKILTRHGEPKLLIDVPNSLMKILSQYRNFIPRIYVSNSAFELLEKNRVLAALRARVQSL